MVHRAVLNSGKTVSYYIGELPKIEVALEDFTVVSMPAKDVAASELRHRGFSFVERCVPLEIFLKRFRSPLPLGKKFTLSITEDWQCEEIYNTAKETFEKDYRFAVDAAQEDEGLKNELLHWAIGDLKQRGAVATCLYREQQLEGFNLWDVQDGMGHILLGAVSARYRSSGIALPLYCQTLKAMGERGASGSRSVIASSNTASLNLHSILIRCAGGEFRFGTCLDVYRKEQGAS